MYNKFPLSMIKTTEVLIKIYGSSMVDKWIDGHMDGRIDGLMDWQAYSGIPPYLYYVG